MLTTKQIGHLRALAHGRKVIVQVGRAGITPAVISEIDAALAHHELVKVKLAGDRDQRAAMTGKICALTRGQAVQNIGRVAIIYRPAETPRIALP
jgi:RNA-binding protein